MKPLALAFALAVAVVPRPAAACLWDYDTLKEETFGQDEVGAILGGDLHKHSPGFYAAKVKYTRAIIDGGKAPKDRYDDLAVALAKGGQIDDALAVLAEKDTRFPGEYTTEANRGTFLAMKGDVAGALVHLKAAVAINPSAHFGRETYQIQLLEYLGRVAKDPTIAEHENLLGLDNGADWAGHSRLIEHMDREPGDKRAVKVPTPPVIALTALVRFGDGQNNPHLWYALAWAFVDEGDAQLAARAFRRAELLGHPRAGKDGAVLATVIHEFRTGCCSQPDSPKSQEAWAKITKRADAEWVVGQKRDQQRQDYEDKLIATKQLKVAFGY